MFVVVEPCYVFVLKFVHYHMFMCNFEAHMGLKDAMSY
jgi:hypothetical protein